MPAPRLDLDSLAPPDRELVFRGVTYMLPGDIPMEDIIAGVRMDAELRAAEAMDDADAQAVVLEAMYDRAMGLIRDRQPDCPNLRLSTSEVTRIIAFASSGNPEAESLESEVLDALVGDREPVDGGAGGDEPPPTVAESAPPRPRGSASRKRSPSASSV